MWLGDASQQVLRSSVPPQPSSLGTCAAAAALSIYVRFLPSLTRLMPAVLQRSSGLQCREDLLSLLDSWCVLPRPLLEYHPKSGRKSDGLFLLCSSREPGTRQLQIRPEKEGPQHSGLTRKTRVTTALQTENTVEKPWWNKFRD